MSKFAKIGENSLHYHEQGSGQPVVFIHAGVSDMRMWQAQLAAFSPNYRAIAYDVRGFGQSVSPEGEYTDHEELAAFLDALDIEKTLFVGASNGGRIAIDFTLTYPERVQGLVLVCPGVGGHEDPPEVEAQWDAIGEVYHAGDKEKAAEMEMDMWLVGPKRKRADIDPDLFQFAYAVSLYQFLIPEEDDAGDRNELEPAALDRLGEINVPTLVIQGDSDVAYHVPLSEKVAAEVPGAELIMIKNAAHLPNLEYPEQFNEIVQEFLTKIVK